MVPMQEALQAVGYRVQNLGYPSRSASIRELSEQVFGEALTAARSNGATRLHLVTHSLGGILARSYLAHHAVPELGHVVMLGPPNRGSEIVDRLGAWKLFQWINGPAGGELGTTPASTPNQLGPACFSLGVIAGSRSINWINSLLIPGVDDGKVSVERTRLPGMADHIVVPAAHPFLMRNRTAIRQTLYFLEHGRFEAPPSS